MKILFWTDAFWPGIGGMEVFCVNLLRALKKRGHGCEVITNQVEAGAPFVFEDVAVHPFPFQDTLKHGQLKLAVAQSAACTQIVDRFQPDVVHLHGVNRGVFHFTRQQKRRRYPAVVTLHDSLLAPERRTMAAWTLEHAQQVIAISDYIRRETLAREPVLDGRLRTILNALPEPEVAPAPLPSEPRLLAIGCLLPHKGFDLAIRAFAGVAEQFPDATLTLVGDGDERGRLETLAAGSGFGPRIRFTGWIAPERMPEMLNRHSLIIVPSRWQEPFGLVALQAAQMGRPVLASRSGGLPEIVVDGITGRLVENDNLAAWTDALHQLLAKPALAATMGREARLHASAHFSFDRLVDDYEQAYDLAQSAKR
jgi:glycogen(starch) synthase